LICKFIDRDNTQFLDIEEFFYVLRGKPNEERQAAIDFVYSRFDQDNKGIAKASDMKSVFNCKQHPKYKMGKLSVDQMFYLYLKNFNNQVKDIVTKKEWDDYYAGLSVAIDDDEHFVKLIKNQFMVE
jgi:Ca2+-binding EF-hand superfamily protein